jgi:signal transduction histidine kinase
MLSNWPRSTSLRLALIVGAAMLVAFVLLGGGVFYAVSGIIGNGLQEVIRAEDKGLLDIYQDQGLATLKSEVADRTGAPDNPDAVYALIDANGRILTGEFSSLPARVLRGHGWVEFNEHTDVARVGVLAYLQPLRNQHLQSEGTLLVGLRTHRRDRFLDFMLRTSLYALLATGVLGLLIGWLTARLVATKLENMFRAAKRVSEGELHARAPLNRSGDAFDRLGAAFNGMLDRIQELLDGVRHATDHIAHDLRTPLTRLRNRLEDMRAAADNPHAPSGPGVAEIDAALADTDQLLSAFGALLRLARIEAQSPSPNDPAIELDAVLRDAMDLYAPIAMQRRIVLSGEIDHVQLQGDADQLFQLAANLLDNALKYAPEHSEVTVRLHGEADAAVLQIADHGPGIPEQHHDRVFDRFVRLESHRGSPGTGLGLSLVRAIVQRHGGRILLEDNAPGLRVRVVLPMAPLAATSTARID